MLNYITYCRVSTDKQGVVGLGMAAQAEVVAAHAQRTAGEVIAAYVEVESGTKSSRPQLRKAIEHCKRTGATLLIAKLDRLARNVLFVATLMESKVEFVAADMPTANRFTIHVMAAFAEMEAEQISLRTKAGLAQAKKKGVKLGGFRGRKTSLDAIESARQTRMEKSAARNVELAPIIRHIQQCGHTSLRQIAVELNARGVQTPKGGSWTATQVMRVTK